MHPELVSAAFSNGVYPIAHISRRVRCVKPTGSLLYSTFPCCSLPHCWTKGFPREGLTWWPRAVTTSPLQPVGILKSSFRWWASLIKCCCWFAGTAHLRWQWCSHWHRRSPLCLCAACQTAQRALRGKSSPTPEWANPRHSICRGL